MKRSLAFLMCLVSSSTFAQSVTYDSRGRALEPTSRAKQLDFRARGVVYERVDPISRKAYVGQAWDWERFNQRIREHNEKLQKETGTKARYEFKVLSRPYQVELDMVEQAWIRKRGGIESLENKRNQVKDFEKAANTRQREPIEERYNRREEQLRRSERRLSERRVREAREQNRRQQRSGRSKRG